MAEPIPGRHHPLSIWLLSAIFVASGVLHFFFPAPYIAIVPPWLPAAPILVLVSGIAEVLGGLGLLIERTRRIAGTGLILLLIAVWPANLQMLLDARASSASLATETALWLRLSLQPLLMLWVWRASRRP